MATEPLLGEVSHVLTISGPRWNSITERYLGRLGSPPRFADNRKSVDLCKPDGSSIDPQRVYLIGLSMGGFGVWDLLSRWPERFAAAVSICGDADENAVAAAWAVPVWTFHGTADRVVPVERSRRTIDALREAGGIPRYTEYPEVGHDSWTHAFVEPDLLPWLFSHRRSTTADPG